MSSADNLRGTSRSVRVAATLVSLIGTLAIGSHTSGEVVPVPTDEARERKWLAELGEGFTLVRSDHFLLAHDLDPSVAGRYLTWMEETHGRVRDFLRAQDVPVMDLPGRLEAACSRRWNVYRRIHKKLRSGESITSGLYDRVSRRTYFGYFPGTETHVANGLDRPVAGSVEDRSLTVAARFVGAPFDVALRLTVRHETAHQVIDATCPGLRSAAPAWLSEGLACVFEGDPTSGTGGPPLWNEWRARDFVDGFEGEGDGPARVIDVIRRPWNGGGGGELTLAQRYATAWAVVFHLHDRHPEALGGYLGRLVLRKDPAPSAERLSFFVSEIGEPDDAFAAAVIQHIAGVMRQAQ